MMKLSSLTVRFYILNAHHKAQDRLKFACTLINKAQQQKKSVVILCQDQFMQEQINQLLWVYPTTYSFLPHCHQDAPEAKDATIWLASVPERIRSAEVFVNLSLMTQTEIPKNCKRIFEIVSQEPEVLQATRCRFTAYRQAQIQIETHHLSA